MDKNSEDLKHIRSMMERSSKFVSLSGISGISAGTIALISALLAKLILVDKLSITGDLLSDLCLLAFLTLIIAGASGLYFSIRKARKMKSKFWMPVTVQIIRDFSMPMLIGAFACIVLLSNDLGFLTPSAMLVFYGLGLIQAGSRTYKDVKVLGFCEIFLGMLAGLFVYNGLLFWTLGFGVLHIIYGILMYFKYDRNAKEVE